MVHFGTYFYLIAFNVCSSFNSIPVVFSFWEPVFFEWLNPRLLVMIPEVM